MAWWVLRIWKSGRSRRARKTGGAWKAAWKARGTGLSTSPGHPSRAWSLGLVMFLILVPVLARVGSEQAPPLADIVVAVDPGHGGHDRGACHLPSGLIEKEINLDMALRLEKALTREGAGVVLTRRDDSFLSLDARAQLANEHGADIFLSLHVNRYPSPDCFGAQTFYLPAAPEGRRLALLIQEELRRIYPPNYRQALPGNYRVLRGTRMPSALVEIGFVTNPTDRALLRQDDYRERVAEAIVQALIRFVRGDTADEAP